MTDHEPDLEPLEQILKRVAASLSLGDMPTSLKVEPVSLEAEPLDDDACPMCGGYRVVRYDLPVGDPGFGKAHPCPLCAEDQQQERAERLRKLSNLDAHKDKTFAAFATDLDYLSAAQAQNLRITKDMCARYAEQPDGWLLLQGGYGSGKTHLAAAVANECINRGVATLFVTAPDLLDHLRSTFGPSSEVAYDELFDRVRNVPLLVVDDLGAESPTQWAVEKLYQVFNHRYNYRLPTVITTNVELDAIEPRIRSRLVDHELTRLLPINVPDYRRGGFAAQESGLTNLSLYGDMRFDTWEKRANLPKPHAENLRRIHDRARRFAEQPAGWLVLTGTYGSGKTHLAAAIAHHRQAIGDTALFVTVPDLLDHLRATFNPESRLTYDRLFQEIRNAPLLVLDDLGTENASPWAREKLFQLLDHRYRGRLPTVFTMSRTLDEIDERLASRMSDTSRSTVMAITAPSYRGQAGRKR